MTFIFTRKSNYYLSWTIPSMPIVAWTNPVELRKIKCLLANALQ